MTSTTIRPSLKLWVKRTSVVANLAIVAGIIIGICQYREFKNNNKEQFNSADRFEKRKNAIEAINKIYNSEFINSLAMLKGNPDLRNNDMTRALNLVFNTYSVIAIVYNNNIADNKIIKESIEQEVGTFVGLNFYKESFTEEEKRALEKMVDCINK